MLAVEPVAYKDVAEAARSVAIPEIYTDIFPDASKRVLEAVFIHEQEDRGNQTLE